MHGLTLAWTIVPEMGPAPGPKVMAGLTFSVLVRGPGGCHRVD